MHLLSDSLSALLKTNINAAKLFFNQHLSHFSTNINKCYLTKVVEGSSTVTSVLFNSLRLIINPFYCSTNHDTVVNVNTEINPTFMFQISKILCM